MFYQLYKISTDDKQMEVRKHIAFFEELGNIYNYLVHTLEVTDCSVSDIQLQLFQWQEAYVGTYLITQENFLD
jgi:hypothetical protein